VIAFTDPVLLFENMSAEFEPNIELLTVPEVARLLKISVISVRRLQQRRLIPFFKIGGSVRFARSDVVSYLDKQRVKAVDQ
jgi:excisionase family DNA binding protein